MVCRYFIKLHRCFLKFLVGGRGRMGLTFRSVDYK